MAHTIGASAITKKTRYMMQGSGQLNESGRVLRQRLTTLASQTHKTTPKDVVHIVGVGGALTSAYEQLRNAAEYTEEHLLLQKAIARFFRRLFVLHNPEQVKRSGGELVTELTLAGYIPNDSIASADVQTISDIAEQYFTAYIAFEKSRKVAPDKNLRWTVEVAASRVESLFNDHGRDMAFAEFAYERVLATNPEPDAQTDKKGNYAVALYIAVHQTLLRADESMIRASLLERYACSPNDLHTYKSINTQLDDLFAADITKKLARIINREGAALRIIRQMVESDRAKPDLFADRPGFLSAAMQQIESEYQHVERRIDRAIVKSVLFLFITKVLIGIAIEVPYDMAVHGHVIWLPLGINLLFPPLFMLLLRYTLVLPSRANTSALIDQIDMLMYEQEKTVVLGRPLYAERSRRAFRIVYGMCAVAILALTAWGLVALQFSWLHIIIFFIFVSTASFLGFRLSRIVRELEVGEADQSAISVIRNFIYMPFVVIGQWMTHTYSQINIIGTILDMVIELPLKTILRLIRQWSRFINERQDEL